MGKLIYRLKASFLTFFGDIRYSKYPPFLFYDDVDFSVKGGNVEALMKLLKNGDVLMRGFDSYVDSFFIRSSRGYSHAGIYSGNGEVIHATAPKVAKEHLIDFCRCDRIAVLRPRKGVTKALSLARKFLKNGVFYDFSYTAGNSALYCFELAACCYQNLSISKKKATALFGMLRKKEKVYLSDSFLESKDFTLVYEFNPKFGIVRKR